MTKTVILGDEFDDHLRTLVAKVLRDMGATTLDEKWGVAGSIELETVTHRLRGQTIVLESETHAGLSITGDAPEVDEIARRVSELLRLYPTRADYVRHAAAGKEQG